MRSNSSNAPTTLVMDLLTLSLILEQHLAACTDHCNAWMTVESSWLATKWLRSFYQSFRARLKKESNTSNQCRQEPSNNCMISSNLSPTKRSVHQPHCGLSFDTQLVFICIDFRLNHHHTQSSHVKRPPKLSASSWTQKSPDAPFLSSTTLNKKYYLCSNEKSRLILNFDAARKSRILSTIRIPSHQYETRRWSFTLDES